MTSVDIAKLSVSSYSSHNFNKKVPGVTSPRHFNVVSRPPFLAASYARPP